MQSSKEMTRVGDSVGDVDALDGTCCRGSCCSCCWWCVLCVRVVCHFALDHARYTVTDRNMESYLIKNGTENKKNIEELLHKKNEFPASCSSEPFSRTWLWGHETHYCEW